MIIQTVDIHTFRAAFQSLRPDNFTSEGLDALFDYIEGISNDIENHIELDVIAICCEYTEYSDISEYNEAYGTNHKDGTEIDVLICELVCDTVSGGFICYEH